MSAELLCCPLCKNALEQDGLAYRCLLCHRNFPIIHGIPDFRVNIDATRRELESVEVSRLNKAYEGASIEQLLTDYLRRTTSDDLLDLDMAYELNWRARGQKELYKIATLFDRIGDQSSFANARGVYVDVGCGKGAMLMTLAARFKLAIGIDASLVYLILARKLAETTAQSNVVLIAAENEHLPLRSDCADFVTSLDVVEHIDDQDAGVAENCRLLRRGGYMFLNSPNRYSLFTPEDHVRLFFVGFMPRALAPSYVRLLSGHTYHGVRLLSRRDISGMVRRHFGLVAQEGIMFDESKPGLAPKERVLKRFPWLLQMLNGVFGNFVPSFHFLAQK